MQRKRLDRKQVDDVLGGDEAWANVDQTEGIFKEQIPSTTMLLWKYRIPCQKACIDI